MKNTGISIIIPCFNAGSYLAEAIESVIKQPFQCLYEAIVIDDGSTDKETQDVLKSIEKYNHIKVVRFKRNRGAQYARNEGLKLAKFDYILPLDADDCLNTDLSVLKEGTYADRAIQILKDRDDVAFIHAISCMFDEYTGYTISAYPVTLSQILHKHHAQTSIIYRKADAINASYYNESIKKWQDWSFAVSLLNARYKQNKENNIVFFDTPFHLYRVHKTTSRISSKNISEEEMTKLTIEHNLEIFKVNFSGKTVDEITNKVLLSKPDKLVDLLYIASNNVNLALAMSKQRGYRLESEIEPINIP